MAQENPSRPLVLGQCTAEEKYSTSLAKIINPKPCGSITKQSQDQNSPSLRRWGSSSSGKPAARQNCLCSPTTHAGSFRCRHHRVDDSLTRVGSVGSNLAVLLSSSKSSRFSNSLKAQ
ncbi:hypothetical protein CARUB_v10028192mg [Capsella rubella]|uniref:Uncharacterized protein n=1 Tax=Capsella rubella TaxID=81985 RepID=R0F0S3_9BRAS|nr:uncharacterized protein LOC17875412 [Capsella rubella]EOA14866.1 hypothetical protein CARUB_v10028192mg [Capsella rubella]